MAITTPQTDGSNRGSLGSTHGARPTLETDPQKYISLGQLIDPNKPDNRDLLISAYGDQGLTGFLTMTGAVNNAGTADEVTWWEEGRLHARTEIKTAATTAAITFNENAKAGFVDARVNDVLLDASGNKFIVGGTAAAPVLKGFDNALKVSLANFDAVIIGNIYPQGSDQPSKFFHPGVKKFINPYIITKETYAVNGSQATNIGWVNVGNGDYRWYVKGEMDARKRFMNQRELMLLFGESHENVLGGTYDGTVDIDLGDAGEVAGSEGYFQAVDRRGITATVSGGAQGTFASMSDIDSIILELDKEGAPSEYAMYVNRATSLDLDDMLANGIATQVTAGLPGQFGAFNNDADMAVKLGFKSFTRGGYTFHKHDWKLLNDSTVGGMINIKGAMVPLTNVTDARTGAKAPALQMNYKGTNGYNRDMEHWVRGSILGHNNMSKDVAEFYYRSECNLCVRAANQHVVLK